MVDCEWRVACGGWWVVNDVWRVWWKRGHCCCCCCSCCCCESTRLDAAHSLLTDDVDDGEAQRVAEDEGDSAQRRAAVAGALDRRHDVRVAAAAMIVD